MMSWRNFEPGSNFATSRLRLVMLHTINCKASKFSLLVDDGNSITVGLNSKWGDKYARDATFKISFPLYAV